VIPQKVTTTITLVNCGAPKNSTSCCETFPFCPIPIDIDFAEKVPFDTLPATEKRLLKEIKRESDPHKRQLIVNDLVRFYMNQNERHKAISFLENETTLASKMILVSAYIKDGQFNKAQQTLNVIPQNNPENQNFVKYYNVMLGLRQNNKTIFELDSLQEQNIRDVAVSPTCIAVNAENVLEIAFNETPPDHLQWPDTSGGNARIAPLQEIDITKPVVEPVFFTIIPNPLVERGIVHTSWIKIQTL